MIPGMRLGKVFSTHVEVFPLLYRWFVAGLGFLHARGGVSWFPEDDADFQLFSPRTWRCFQQDTKAFKRQFVFSTHVEVFLEIISKRTASKRFLHARGGVSS